MKVILGFILAPSPFAMILLEFSVGLSLSFPQMKFYRTYGGTEWENGASAQQTSDGGNIIAGTTYSVDTSDVVLIKARLDGVVTVEDEQGDVE